MRRDENRSEIDMIGEKGRGGRTYLVDIFPFDLFWGGKHLEYRIDGMDRERERIKNRR